MILVVDDIIPKSLQQEIRSTLFGTAFAWYYNEDITYGDKSSGEKKPAAFHALRSNGEDNSPWFNYVSSIAHAGAVIAKYKYNTVSQARCFLQYPLNPEFSGNSTDRLHVDSPIDHLVVLYYVNDSDGDTIIVDKKLQGERDLSVDVNLKVEDHKIIQKVSPKMGRAVIFDGRYYHTAEQPKHNMRCVINFNVV